MTERSETAAPAGELALPTEFQFDKLRIRTVLQGDDPWFAAKDVCRVLGITNSRDAVSDLDADEKGVVFTDTRGGRQKLGIVSESGLYELIRRSEKPAAKRLFKWVTSQHAAGGIMLKKNCVSKANQAIR